MNKNDRKVKGNASKKAGREKETLSTMASACETCIVYFYSFSKVINIQTHVLHIKCPLKRNGCQVVVSVFV